MITQNMAETKVNGNLIIVMHEFVSIARTAKKFLGNELFEYVTSLDFENISESDEDKVSEMIANLMIKKIEEKEKENGKCACGSKKNI